jgi:uncharacterized iron-regulated protein
LQQLQPEENKDMALCSSDSMKKTKRVRARSGTAAEMRKLLARGAKGDDATVRAAIGAPLHAATSVESAGKRGKWALEDITQTKSNQVCPSFI